MPEMSSHAMLHRRQFMQLGGLASLGWALPRLLHAAPAPANPARACILIYYYGGPSQLDTWDLKPNAPAEIRGEFRPIATRVPGVFIGEHLPRTAQIADKIAIVRSLHHPMRNHNSAAVESLCGRTPLRGDLELLANDPNSFPCFGAALNFIAPGRADMPTHVALPHVMHNVVVLPGQNAGFLGSTYDAFQVTRDPNDPDFRIGELELTAGLSPGRLEDRRSLLGRLEASAGQRERASMTAFQRRAFELLRSENVRRAFDLNRETAATRERFGRNTLGQSMLLARRLVESGVRFVNVNDKITNGQTANWDSHENNFGRLKNDLLPPADQAYSALIADLADRGMLESTLVVALAEFGRTPRINGNAGRDHWPDCFSMVLAGGGVQGGVVYGSSDRFAAYPATDPVTPGDLAATLFRHFGLDAATELRDLTGRPYRLAEGEPLTRLFG
jgi:uncharacterized protein (DUF1501 family)